MRVALSLVGKEGRLRLPRQYNELVQGFIYKHLDGCLAKSVHDEGFADPRSAKRKLKLFAFSRLSPDRNAGGRWRFVGEHIEFQGPVCLVISSPMVDFLSSLAEHLLTEPRLMLGDQELELLGVGVEGAPEHRRPVLVRTLSPITIYSTLQGGDGKKKTYYYTPFECEFSELLVKNLVRKVRVWEGREVEAEGEVRPIKVSKRNEHVLNYKGTVIKAWSGIYELDLPPRLFQMAFDAGLGAKNSQGFGCIEVWKPSTNRTGRRKEGKGDP